MKTIKLLTAVILGLSMANVGYTQTWNTTGNTGTTPGTTAGQNFVGTTDAKDLVFGVGNASNVPTEYMRLKSADGSLNLQAANSALNLNNNSSMYGGTYLNFLNHGTQVFNIGVGSYPSCGSGIFRMFPIVSSGTAKGINFGGTQIGFGVPNYPGCGTALYAPVATYYFDNTVTSPSYIVAGVSSSPVFTPPSGYIFSVAGNSYMSGKLAIGTSNTPNDFNTAGGYRLYVTGGILTEKVKVAVATSSNWADYVFNKDYKLRSLAEVETYVNKNKHLPGVPSADEVVKEGIDMATMDAKLLEKIEELTLYLIEMKKENETLKKRLESLEADK